MSAVTDFQKVDREVAKYLGLGNGPWIDIHAHLNFLEASPEESILTAQKYGVQRIITIGTEPNDLSIVLGLARKHYPTVCCTLGIHPHEAQLFTPEIEKLILKEGPSKEVAAVGEIGLDYYYNNSPHDVQRDAFHKQLELAEKLGLPVEIHTRDAEADTIEILEKFRGKVKGVIHCFTGTMWLAEKALDLGFNISMSGIVTFKNAQALRDVANYVPIDRLHIETDSPFLTPAPFRGVKNSPHYVVFTAQFISELKKIPLPELSQQLLENAYKMFPKLPPIS
ncbi:MAG: TatD family hydrolase [Bdellovibrionales bacterium]|nr:TatD family hydrolase [Bdellovibrionales bacterium]